MAEKREKAAAECLCKGCPTYSECGEQTAFCLGARSKCIKEENGCLCGACPVRKRLDFKHYYYCLRGPETAQNKR